MDHQNLRHLHGLRDFIRNLVEQAERSGGCECHRPPSLLLVGPPGVGKTYLVKQMSNVCDMPLFGVHTHQLSGPTNLRNMFVHARELDYPSLFFLDDIDFIFSNHDLTPAHNEFADMLRKELYKQLGPRKLKIFDRNSSQNPVQDPLPSTPSPQTTGSHQEEEDSPDNNGLILVAATSSPWLLYKDHELLSRFRGVYLVGLPDRETRFYLLKYLLEKVQHNLTEKDFWVAADKTEGYTPSDLLMIAKSLNFEQFALLLSMAAANSYEDSDDDSLTASEMTETDIDSNYDQVDQLTKRLKEPNGKEESKSSSGDDDGSSCNIYQSSKEATSKNEKDTTIGAIERDWSMNKSEADLEKKQDLDNKSNERAKSEEDIPFADGATTDSTLTDTKEEGVKEADKASPDSIKPSGTDNCDNSSNVKDSDVVLDGANRPGIDNISSVSEVPCEKREHNVNSSDALSNSDDETKEFELRIYQPADPLRNDNQAVDSGSESDNENGGDFVKRARRVNFCNVPSMHPLSVDIDHSEDMNSNISLGYEPVSISPGLDDNLLSKNPYGGTSSNNILKRLLSSSPTLHEEMDDDNLISKNERNKDNSSLSKEDRYHDNNYMSAYSNIERNSVGVDETDSCRTRKVNNNDDDLQTFPRSPTILRNNLTDDRRLLNQISPILTGVSSQLTGVSPQLTGVSPRLTGVSSQLTGVSPQLTGVSPQLTGVSPQLTPTGSNSSSNNNTDNSSESGSGRRIRINTPTPDSQKIKIRDSDSSLYGKSDTPTIPSSDVSSAACNVSGETLECHSDSDERLRNLEDDLKGKRPRASDSEDDDDDDLSEENVNANLRRTIFNLNSLGDVSIKILTLNDVLNVISRTPKSVSDEEIKQYTDFMVWFANVAKSACPHNSKGTTSNTASSADVSVVSSMWSQTPSTKKRKGPLKKLGRFLLKALMFILD